jgi:hypothetical protein
MDLESMHILWNILISLVFAPIFYSIRQNSVELKRLDILINKTREEVARDYVLKSDNKDIIKSVMERFDKLEEKIDKLMEK